MLELAKAIPQYSDGFSSRGSVLCDQEPIGWAFVCPERGLK